MAGPVLTKVLVISKSPGAETTQSPDIVKEGGQNGENNPDGADGL